MSSASNSPPEGYFNNLSQATGNAARSAQPQSPTHSMDLLAEAAASNASEDTVPKLKRIACIICRKRKLKCDGTKPSCSTCARLGHNCAYDEVRRKSGPKRGYVKALEERLKQVETLLKTQEPAITPPENVQTSFPANTSVTNLQPNDATFDVSNPSISMAGVGSERWDFNASPQAAMEDLTFASSMSMGLGLDDNTFTWEMIGLGLDEPLPPQETIDELHQIYFDKIHPSLPMIHKYRYLAAMNLAPNQRPPVALRYAMWTLAASVVEKYMNLRDHFYQRARKYMEQDYMKGHGESLISIAHAQAHTLLASFEFKMMYFPRAWMSTGSAIRLCQMMGLHRLDGKGLDVKQCIAPPRDWTEREERSRTFWMAFAEDRYASIGTGWPMTVDEKDIMTDLPSSDEAFDMSKPERTQSLADAMSPAGASKLSSFAGVIVMACFFGRNLIHLHRPDADEKDHDLNGDFWKRHRQMDHILLNISLSLPSHLRLPNGLTNPNIVFVNMNIHTSTICLHQAAIYKADKNKLPSSVSSESKMRCISAANEIASIMRMVSHLDLSNMNPFISFCLYVAARVFVQYLKSRPDDSQTADSLRFLLSAMNALKRKNPLSESFLVQLDVDLEGLGMRTPQYKSVFAYTDNNLGVSDARAPKIGNPDLPKQRNECFFLPHDDENLMDEALLETTATASNSFCGLDQTKWTSLPDHTKSRSQDAQETIADPPTSTLNSTYFDLLGNSSYINQESIGTGNDTGFSPDTTNSNRLTPNSNTSGDTHSSLHPSSNTRSGNASHEPSPMNSGQASAMPSKSQSLNGFFAGSPDYCGRSSTGMTPNSAQNVAETPGGDFPVPQGWEMSNQTTGLTPVGEGVFRQLMGLGPESLEAMDLGWEGST